VYWHVLAETLKLAWRDRLRYFGDPIKAKVDWELLAGAAYNAARAESLRQFPNRVDVLPGPAPQPSPGTIHISTGDHEGNMVAITISHGGSFGSSVTVPGTGVTLGHGMCRFDPHPGLPNSVASQKRPLNNVCPTILVLPDRRVALGLRGGRRIVSANLGLILQLAHGASPLEAVQAPRIHNEGYEPVEISTNFPDLSRMELDKMGHRLTVANYIGHANVVDFRDGVLRGGSDVWCAGLS
jgi:gamma-glutamyltranspeptidase/glutathione hydrolase